MDIYFANIRQKLFTFTDEKYKLFSSSLLPDTKNIIGVRLPILRKIAKEIASDACCNDFIYQDAFYLEEFLLQGFVIGLLFDTYENEVERIKKFVPKINNWAVCDSFCTGLKFINKNVEIKNTFFEFLLQYQNSMHEFEQRFFYVSLLNYYVEEKYLSKIFDFADNFNHTGYYARMAVSWLICVCYTKFKAETLLYLEKSNLDNWTYNKAIQKIIESNKTNKDEKMLIKQLKR